MDTDKITLTSEEWEKKCDWKILDPDGWDRSNFQYSFYEEKIPYDEFIFRLLRSTVMGKYSVQMGKENLNANRTIT